MNASLTILKRNLLNYIYDPSTVFFSFLSVFILIGVYGVFLGTFQVQAVEDSVGNIEGISFLVNSWLVAGLLTVSSFTVPLSIMSNMVLDLENRIFDDFLIAPIKRYELVIGYALSAFVIGSIMTLITFIGSEIFIVLSGGTWLSLLGHLNMVGLILFANFVFSGLSFLIVSFIKSVASVNAINTIIGTTIGFLAGIYVPFAAFSETFANIIKFNPAAHLVTSFRQIMMQPSLDIVFKDAPLAIREDYETLYGVVLDWFGMDFNMGLMLLYVGILGVIFYVFSSFRMQRFKR